MSELPLRKVADIYERAFRGELELIGWGHRDFFHFQRWQEQFPLKVLTDTNYNFWDQVLDGHLVVNPLALRDYSAKHSAVISYYNSPWVNDYVERIGKMPLLPPLPLQHIMRLIVTKGHEPTGMPSPLAAKVQAHVIDRISDNLENYDARPGKQTLGARQHYHRNLKLLGSYHWTDFMASACASIKPHSKNKKSVVLAGNSWCTGGAERQMLNLAMGFSEKGWETHSLSVMEGENAPHYMQLLLSRGIPIHHVFGSEKTNIGIDEILAPHSPLIRSALWHLPITLTMRIAYAMRFFQKIRPNLLISYLDCPNAIAGLAAVLTGVPNIILSGRNYPPTCFPHFFRGYEENFRQIYSVLASLPQVYLTNNSRLAGEAYAEWIGLPKPRIRFIGNCLTQEFMKSPAVNKTKNMRVRFGLQPSDQIVLGVFRLAPEKRPEKFLKVVRELVKNKPNVRAIICGTGMMQSELDKLVAKYQLRKHVIFAGVVGEVREMMSIADILLHVSEFEGMPNVLLEAQAQGIPVVCTRSGGVVDCLAPELLPYSFAKNDWKGVTTAALRLLNRPILRAELGKAAEKFARREFSLNRLIARNLALTKLSRPESGRKVI